MCVYNIKKDWARKNTNSTARRLQHEINAADADHTAYIHYMSRAYPILYIIIIIIKVYVYDVYNIILAVEK